MTKKIELIKGEYRDTIYPSDDKPTADDLHNQGRLMAKIGSTEYYEYQEKVFYTYWCSPLHEGDPAGWLVVENGLKIRFHIAIAWQYPYIVQQTIEAGFIWNKDLWGLKPQNDAPHLHFSSLAAYEKALKIQERITKVME